jgi:pteridine reductase
MKLALVTGGFRRVGAAIAARLANDGWTLALHSRKAAEPEADLAIALHANQTKWHGFCADLANGDEVLNLLPRIHAHFGAYPNLIVNNASMFIWDNPENVTPQALAAHHGVNVSAPVILACALANYVVDDARVSVVNILDQRIRQPNSDQLSYTLSKQALAAATDTLARSLAPKVRVNAVAPGLTLATDDYRPAQLAALETEMPLGLLPDPEDIAEAVAWLSAARATTGQTIFVDGGASLKSFPRDFVFMDV